ncbi:MAG: asparagine synthase-related protein [Chthonomonadales bacterium]
MLQGVERLITQVEFRHSGLTGASPAEVESAIHAADLATLSATDGHFAGVARDGQTIRLARTIGIPLRYFVAKMFHGPILIAADRIDTLFDWCQEQRIGWQFDPMYTRMVPAHYLVEIDQIGCPDPAPRYHRFFKTEVETGSNDLDELGAKYVGAAYRALKAWVDQIPANETIAVAFSGGIDSSSVLLMLRKAILDRCESLDRLKAFTLNMGDGKDAAQAEAMMVEFGMRANWEEIRIDDTDLGLEEAISVIEDYHPLDVECAAVALKLLAEIRRRYPTLKYLVDGDGGDENLKSYPLEDSDLTISSILRNPLLYQEGWGALNMKHSATYSGGLSRSYVRTYAPGAKYGFEAFSPYSVRSAIAESVKFPFEQLLNGSVERLYSLKGDVVSRGVKQVTGDSMPVHPKRRFQEGAIGDSYRDWKVSKAACRQIFLRQWEDRLKSAWEANNQMSGNEIPDGTLAGR